MNVISIRRFNENDINYKVKWVNDPENNKYLHYALPLRADKTLDWYNAVKERKDRADYTILCNDKPVGLIGLLNIDYENKKAEYYIMIGEKDYKGKGIAEAATNLLLTVSYNEYGLNRIYLFTRTSNLDAQKLFEKIGFNREGLLKDDIIHNGCPIDRYIYGLDLDAYMNKRMRVINSNALV